MRIRTDKLLHVETSALLVIMLARVLSFVMPSVLAIILASFATFGIGFAKEYYDYSSGKGTAERGDVRADAIGILVGIILSI